ncbi:DsrH/TusB family sulfur relay protein [Pasteurella multocida]|uniref:DsrH/TusB family sulfur relay protein n=1 Tax=Pasteurella multocida TaxID=747 RepID=UPI002B49F8C3|nr:DsrH/TusB family sulfur relay protein [Pasteurella multocida]MEB3475669.1 DsrH/TusB family sulfur relay protein [Pasteurella multocida]MEB3507436.1 DsrH/TusB family sulfur relay protein [Pasteurella multocida]WRJ98752.1 DsrH/TusB family sulfur relay protein [Pasteurella multocida]
MLYTFAEASYPESVLLTYLQQTTPQDAIVLWQDGVYLCVKYPEVFSSLNTSCYALDIDVGARNLYQFVSSIESVKTISLTELVELTEHYFPQLAL